MMLDANDLGAIRECCRDDAAFERLQTLLAKRFAMPDRPLPAPRRDRYEAILRALPDRVFLVNRNGENLDVRDTHANALQGLEQEQAIGANLHQFLPPEVTQRCLEAIARTLDSGQMQTLEYRLPSPWEPYAGEWRDYEICLTVSGPEEVLVIERDITRRKRTQLALQEREYRYRSLYNHTPVMLHSIDCQGCLISVSEYWLSSLGYTRREVLGRKSVEFMTPASRHYAETVVLPEYFRTGVCKDVPYQFVKKTGEIMDVLLSAIAERDAEGSIVRSLAVLLDVTERKRAEQAIDRERRLFASGPVTVFRWRAADNWPVEYVSANVTQFGYQPEAFANGLDYGHIVHPDDLARVGAEVQECVEAGLPAIEQDYRILCANGEVRWVYDFCGIVRNDDGVVTHYEGYVLDITERKRSEEALRESEEKFATAFRCSPIAIALTTLQEARLIDVNDSFLKITGYQREEVIGRTVPELDLPVDLSTHLNLLTILQASRIVSNVEIQVRRKSGAIGTLLFSAEVIEIKGELCVLCVMSDISDRKQAEEALEVSEARNLAFLNAIPDLMFRISRDGVYRDCKADQESDFAIPAEAMIGKTVYDVLPPAIARQRMEYIERTLATGEIQIFEYQLPSRGELRDYEARLVVSGPDEVLAIVRDITQRKRAAAQIQANAERDRLLGQIALRIRRSLNLDQILTTTVAEVRQFLEADRVFIGQIDANWQGRVVAESAAPAWGSILAWIADDIYLREIRALFAQGQVQAIDDTATAAVSPLLADYYSRCHIKASLGVPIILGDDFFGVLIVNQCARSRHWSEFEITLLGQLATQVAIAIQQAELYQQVQTLATDLERQVQQRTAQLQQNMQELQELSQIKDDFLNAVSHDLRTPVMGMMMVLKNLQNKAGDSVTVSRSILERMVQSCDRQLNMINSLLEAHSSEARGMTLHCESVNLNTLLSEITADIEPLMIEHRATLVDCVPANLPLVMVDPALIRRVFENLLTNALKHNPPGLCLTLHATLEDEAIRCSVQDDGIGMSAIERDSVFERYARGSRARRSTGIGLGLYLCRQIIVAHGGQIGAVSAPGQGATFWFTLPLAH